VLAPAIVILPGLLVYAVAERLASIVAPTRSEDLVLRIPAS
jgi:hypothetical protein